MSSYLVRDATAADAVRCAEIYAPYVTSTAITFEETAPDAVEMGRRITGAQLGHAWLVLETADPDAAGPDASDPDGSEGAGRVIGYAYAGPLATRAAYRWTAEVSVYLEQGSSRRGGGRALYAALLPRLVERGFRVAMACMTVPNDASVGLHEALGFEHVGTYPGIGWKLGAWHDVSWMQLRLPAPGDPGGPPSGLR